ncbi:MAG: O-antigen ligase family protein [Thermoguttaceae bacterium]
MKQRVGRADRWRRAISSVATLLAQGILLASVLIAPWLLGGVEPPVQIGLLVAVMLALLCWLVKQLADRPATAVLPTAFVPLAAAIGLGLLQLVPLDSKSNAFLSPSGARLRATLLDTEPPADASLAEPLGVAAIAEHQPLSLYPASTRHDLAMLTLAAGVFVLGAGFFHTPGAQVWLCTLLAVNGAALAFFGFVQQLTWKGMLYWNIPLLGGGAPFGPFVCRNNAGGFLNLCLAGAAGMTILVVGRHGSSGLAAERFPRQERRGLLERAGCWSREFVLRLNATTLSAVILMACIVAGIFCSLSRGAFLAMIGATVLTALVVSCAQRRIVGGWLFAVIAAAGLGLVSWVGMSDAVKSRLATLLNQEALEHDRIPLWKDSLKALPDFWRLGSGLGTYRYVYGLYQQEPCYPWAYHAENQYVETLVECGIPGLALLLTMIVLVAVAGWRLLCDARDRRTTAFATAGFFALTSQAIANSFDPGLYAAANMLLLALWCGAMSGGAAELAHCQGRSRLLALPRVRAIGVLVTVALLAASAFGCLEIRRLAAVEAALKELNFTQNHTEYSPQTVVSKIEQLSAAAECREDDAEAHYYLARLWIFLYRLHAFEDVCAEAPPDADRSSLWQITSPVVIQRQLHQFVREGRLADLDSLRNHPVVRDHLRPALKHLVLARRACPLLPGVHVLIAELCGLVADPAGDQVPLETARRLVPSEPEMLFRVGLLAFQAGRTDWAYDTWRESLVLSSTHLQDILTIVDEQVQTPGVIEKLLPPSPSLLIQLAQGRYRAPEQAGVRRLLTGRAEELIEQVDLPEAEKHALRGAACAMRECYPDAIANYRLAVRLRPREMGWHYGLALALWHSGSIEEASLEARWCALADPGKSEYRALVEEINRVRMKPLPSVSE